MWTDYDEDADIFYVRLRPDVQDARTQEGEHGVLIDRDPTTEEVVGIEIMDFLGHFAVLPDLSWLLPFGVPADVLPLLSRKAHELQQAA
jgi:uncharacterized protein YuzE